MRPKLSLALLLANVVLWSHFGYSEEKIRIGISAVSLGFLPTVVAEKKGFYAKYGLAPEHVLVPCAIATNAILSEDLDYNVCTGPGIAGAIKGLPIKLVMTTQDKLGYLLLVKPSVQKLADLRGKTIGISTFGSQLYLTSTTLFRQAGLEPGKDINLLPGGDNSARLAAMEAGKVDAVFVSSPSDIFGVKRGYKVLLWSRDHVPLTQNTTRRNRQKTKAIPRTGEAYDQRHHRGSQIHQGTPGRIRRHRFKVAATGSRHDPRGF